MPRIEDIAKIWEPWTPIKDDLEDQGYQKGPTSLDESRADQRTALFTNCPGCDQHCDFVCFNKDMRFYRSYVVCYPCDIAHRLS